MRPRLIPLAFCLSLSPVPPTFAASVGSVPVFNNTRTLIVIGGRIEPGDSAKLLRLIGAAKIANRPVNTVVLESPGGSLLEGVRLAEVVRSERLKVSVPVQCASACFLVFAGAPDREAGPTAKIGVHGASDAVGKSVGDATVAMAQYSRLLGVPYSIIGKMVVTPPNEMLWLDRNDLSAMGTAILRSDANGPVSGKASILPAGADRNVKSILSKRAEQDALCEQNSGPYDPSPCYARAALDRQLYAVGWCLRRQNGPDGWHRCDETSIGP